MRIHYLADLHFESTANRRRPVETGALVDALREGGVTIIGTKTYTKCSGSHL